MHTTMATENNNKNLNVPNLRFPEFSGEWEHVALSEIAARVTRKNKDNASKLPLTISAQYGLVDQISFFNKVVASADMSNYYLLRQGEFAYNKSYSSDYPWGAIKRLDRYPQGALSSLYICFAVNDKVDSDFAVHYFESSKWHREVSNIAGEGARNHGLLNIAVGDFFDTKHRLPSSKEEQKKIAALLNLITERIATQIKIIEKLESLIKGLCSSLFDKNKYDSFVRLGDISEITNGNSDVQDASLSYSDGMYPFFDRSEDIKFLPEYLLDKEAIIYPGEGSEFYPRYYNGKFALHQRCYAIYDIAPNFATRYLYFFCKTQNSYFVRNAVGSTVASLRLDTFKRLNIPNIPIELQKTYVQLLDKIETKIVDNKIVLKKYEEQKRYLLSNLFI